RVTDSGVVMGGPEGGGGWGGGDGRPAPVGGPGGGSPAVPTRLRRYAWARRSARRAKPPTSRPPLPTLRHISARRQTLESRLYHAAMTEQPRVNIPEWTVSELSAALKRTVEDAYGFVRVRGEISGYRGPHSSGHCYFSLKDEGARIDAVIWRGTFGRIRFKPEEGLEVIATGRLTTYPGKSSYQIVIDRLEP